MMMKNYLVFSAVTYFLEINQLIEQKKNNLYCVEFVCMSLCVCGEINSS